MSQSNRTEIGENTNEKELLVIVGQVDHTVHSGTTGAISNGAEV